MNASLKRNALFTTFGFGFAVFIGIGAQTTSQKAYGLSPDTRQAIKFLSRNSEVNPMRSNA